VAEALRLFVRRQFFAPGVGVVAMAKFVALSFVSVPLGVRAIDWPAEGALAALVSTYELVASP
jgi:hypothetical protein